MKMQASRYHDISVGHRVVGHEGKCRHLHGHNYRIHFHCEAQSLDDIGRVIDFSVIKDKLCMWLEDNWDHKFLFWTEDVLFKHLADCTEHYSCNENDMVDYYHSLVGVPFNPTAENMADYLLNVVAPKQLEGLGVVCTKVTIEETRKCSVTAEL